MEECVDDWTPQSLRECVVADGEAPHNMQLLLTARRVFGSGTRAARTYRICHNAPQQNCGR